MSVLRLIKYLFISFLRLCHQSSVQGSSGKILQLPSGSESLLTMVLERERGNEINKY